MNERSKTELRRRIVAAFIFTILLSAVAFAVVYSFLLRYTTRTIAREYDINNPTYESVYNNTLLISRHMDEEIRRIQEIEKTQPEQREDREYLAQENEVLEASIAFLLTTKEGTVWFNGSRSLSYRRIQDILGQERELDGEEIYSGQAPDGSLFRQIRIQYKDGKTGNLYLISSLDRIAPELRAWLMETIVLIIIVLLIISLLMSRWIYRGVSRPIRELKTATQNIRDGNLDFSVKRSGIEELDELCQDFEEMRIRLKESAESQLESDRQSRELISNISHDLKTPVTTIKGYVEGILDGVANTPEKMEHYLKTVRNKANDMDRLIDELRAYSHIDTNRIPYNFIKLQVSDFFSDCAEELSMELEEEDIAFSYYNYLQQDAVIIADPEQLRRVINNIVGNSVKYRKEEVSSFVNLRLRDVGDFIQIEIEDNGKGIAQKDLSRVFDRFYRSDTARSSQGGSGIGLSIVKKILEDHEGKVWATSKEGEGTVIYFVLRKYQEAVPEPEQGKKEYRIRIFNRRAGKGEG